MKVPYLTFKNLSKLKWIGVALQLGLGGFSLYWISRWGEVNLGQLAASLSNMAFLPAMLGVGCFVMAMLLGALRYSLFLPKTISKTYLIGTMFFQNALLTFVPWRIGEASYPLLLYNDYGVSLPKSTVPLLMTRLIDFGLITTVAIMGAGRLNLELTGIENITKILVALTSFILLAFYLWHRYGTKFVIPFIKTLGSFLELRKLISLIFFSLAVFTLTTAQSMFILHSVSLKITLLDAALLNAFSLLVALLPIHPPGGWGTIDSVQMVLLEQLGYHAADIAPFILAAHSVYTLMIFGGGVVGWIVRRKAIHFSRNSLTS